MTILITIFLLMALYNFLLYFPDIIRWYHRIRSIWDD